MIEKVKVTFIIGLQFLCSAYRTGICRSVLYLQMKRIYGCTPNNYLNEARMNHARRMLDSGHTNISEIAYQCGYSDPKYFSRSFKKSMGITPSEYLKRSVSHP